MGPDGTLHTELSQGSRRTPAERRAAADDRRARRAGVTDVAVVMEAAAAELAVRPRTVDQMRQRLRRLGYQAELREQALARLIELGYLDDAAFARAWVESRDRAHPRGEVVLRRELRARGVADDAITAALSGRAVLMASSDTGDDPDGELPMSGDERAARRLLERRRASLDREPDPRRRRQKAYAMLARNGFDPDVCQRVASALVAGANAV